MAQVGPVNGVQLQQSVAYTRLFWFGTAAQTVVVNLSKAGAAFAAAAGLVTEIANGWYKIGLTAADTATPGDLAYHCTAGSGGPLDFQDQVVSQVFQQLQLDANGRAITSSNIQKNAALNGFTFVMTSTTLHAPQPGLTVTAQRSLGGAGFAPCVNSVTELSNGVYSINLAASDTNASTIMLRFTAAGADDLDMLLITQP